jgi:cysteine synthase
MAKTYPDVCDSILETVGHTPLVRLHKVTRSVAPDVLAKVEFFNPGARSKIASASRSSKMPSAAGN